MHETIDNEEGYLPGRGRVSGMNWEDIQIIWKHISDGDRVAVESEEVKLLGEALAQEEGKDVEFWFPGRLSI